jgi:hypothetical protein
VVPLFERMSGGGAGFDVVEVGVGAGVCMIEELKYVSRSRLNLGLSHEPLGVGRPACYSG